MDLFNKVYVLEPMKVHTFEPNIRLIRLFSLMLNYTKPRIFVLQCNLIADKDNEHDY